MKNLRADEQQEWAKALLKPGTSRCSWGGASLLIFKLEAVLVFFEEITEVFGHVE
jgi:hypothetical protein